MRKAVKQLSTVFILFFFVFTLGFSHYSDGDNFLSNVDFITQNNSQVFLNNRAPSNVFIDINLITSLTLMAVIIIFKTCLYDFKIFCTKR